MPCEFFTSSDGKIIGVACSRVKKCIICGKPATAYCDATRKDGKPCNAPMCEEHRNTVACDTDVCQYHNHPKFIKQAIENRKRMEV